MEFSKPVSGEVILVVDDVEPVRKIVCAFLTRAGYCCLEAADGTEAMEIVERGGQIHLLLTDIMMPRMGGRELAQQVATVRPDVRIMFMSGFTEDSLVRSMEQGDHVFLAKPFTSATLVSKVRQIMDQPWRGLAQGLPA